MRKVIIQTSNRLSTSLHHCPTSHFIVQCFEKDCLLNSVGQVLVGVEGVLSYVNQYKNRMKNGDFYCKIQPLNANVSVVDKCNEIEIIFDVKLN